MNTYSKSPCRFCGKQVSTAGAARYAHMSGHWRRTFGERPPTSLYGPHGLVANMVSVLMATSRIIR